MINKTVEVCGPLVDYAQQQADGLGDADAGQYVARLLAEDQRRHQLQALEEELAKGLDSGASIEADDAYWERKKETLTQRGLAAGVEQ